MRKRILPWYIIALMFIGVVVCSLFAINSLLFVLAAAFIYALLWICTPSPILILAPVCSLLLQFILGSGTDFDIIVMSCIFSLSYVLPAVIIAMGYLSKRSKIVIVINGAIAVFLYLFVIVMLSVYWSTGAITPETLNSVINTQFEAILQSLTQSFAVAFSHEEAEAYVQAYRQLLYVSKPILPACYAAMSFVFSYILVCCVNVALKKLNVIENKRYVLAPFWGLGIFFIVCTVLNSIMGINSLISVIFASAAIIFMPLYFMIFIGFAYEMLYKLFKNKITCTITIVIIVLFSVRIYNLFALTGAYYSIITGVKNSKFYNRKGGNQ